MSEQSPSVAELLFDWPGAAREEDLPGYRREAQTEALRREVERQTVVPWEEVGEAMDGAVRGLFELPLGDLVWRAWLKLEELQAYRDPARHPPDEVSLVPLASHEIVSTHRPWLEVKVGARTLGRIEFSLQARLAMEGVLLEIRGGRVLALRSGRCRFRGRISCGPATLLDKSTAPFELPGRLPCDGGLPIPAV